jgi:hypothetical protein
VSTCMIVNMRMNLILLVYRKNDTVTEVPVGLSDCRIYRIIPNNPMLAKLAGSDSNS